MQGSERGAAPAWSKILLEMDKTNCNEFNMCSQEVKPKPGAFQLRLRAHSDSDFLVQRGVDLRTTPVYSDAAGAKPSMVAIESQNVASLPDIPAWSSKPRRKVQWIEVGNTGAKTALLPFKPNTCVWMMIDARNTPTAFSGPFTGCTTAAARRGTQAVFIHCNANAMVDKAGYVQSQAWKRQAALAILNEQAPKSDKWEHLRYSGTDADRAATGCPKREGKMTLCKHEHWAFGLYVKGKWEFVYVGDEEEACQRQAVTRRRR